MHVNRTALPSVGNYHSEHILDMVRPFSWRQENGQRGLMTARAAASIASQRPAWRNEAQAQQWDALQTRIPGGTRA